MTLAGLLSVALSTTPPAYVCIPADVMCLSECALIAAKTEVLDNHGIMGWHKPYDPETMLPTIRAEILQMLDMSKANHGPNYLDLADTSPSVFYMQGGGFDGDLINWRDVVGYTVVSSFEALPSC